MARVSRVLPLEPPAGPPRPRGWRAPALATALSAAGVALSHVALAEVLRRQAALARRAIGKQLGEEAHPADGLFKKKYGHPVELLLLGDSIAAGLGAESGKHGLGAQLATRLAKRSRRSVRLTTAARVGSESSMLAGQLASLPLGYRADVAVIVVGGNDVTHRVRVADAVEALAGSIRALREEGTEVVVGTCPDLGTLRAVPQPLRALAGRSSRQLAAAQRRRAVELGAHSVSLAEVVGPFFLAQPDEMFSLDRFHPSGAGYRRTAKAMLPSVLVALGLDERVPFGHHPPTVPGPAPGGFTEASST